MTTQTRQGSGRQLRLLLPPGLVAAAAAVVVGYVAAVDPNTAGHYPTCPFLVLTGYWCPGCGSLRAIHALAHGDLTTALSHNVLTVTFVPVLAALWVGWVRRCWLHRPRATLAHPLVMWALLAGVLAFWLLRNLSVGAVLAP